MTMTTDPMTAARAASASRGYVLFRTYVLAIVGATSLAFAFGLPHLIIPRMQGPLGRYAPLTTKTTFKTDESVYAAEIREASEGHWIAQDAYRYEHPRWPAPRAMGSAFVNLVLGIVTRALGSVTRTFIVGSFVFIFLDYLLTALLLTGWTGRPFLSAAAAAVMLAWVQILSVATLTPTWLSGARAHVVDSMSPLTEFNTFGRTPIISFTFLIFIAVVWLWSRALDRRTTRAITAAGVAFGLTFYTYLYYWTLFVTAAAVLAALLWVGGRRDALRALVRVAGIGLVLSLPWVVSVAGAQVSGFARDFAPRVGLQFGRVVDPLSWRYALVGLGFAVWGLRDRSRLEPLLIAGLVLSGVICLNAQVVTGFTIQPHHWSFRVLDPLMIVAAAYAVGRAWPVRAVSTDLSTSGALRTVTAFACATAVVAGAVAYAYSTNLEYSRRTYAYQKLPADTAAAYDWLDQHTQTDDVVLSLSIENSMLVPIYTRDKVFLPLAWQTSASEEESWDRLLTAFRVFGVPRRVLAARLNADNAYVPWVTAFDVSGVPDTEGYEGAFFNLALFGGRYRFWPGYVPREVELPADVRAAVEKGALTFYFPQPLRRRVLAQYAAYPSVAKTLLTKYRIDYLYDGPYEKTIARFRPDRLPWLTKVYSSGAVDIYRVDVNAAAGAVVVPEADPVQLVKDLPVAAPPALFDAWVGNTTSRAVDGFPGDGSRFTWKVFPQVPPPGRAAPVESATFVNAADGAPDAAGRAQTRQLVAPRDGATVAGSRVEFAWRAVPGATNYDLFVQDAGRQTVGEVIEHYRYFGQTRWEQIANGQATAVTLRASIDPTKAETACRPPSPGRTGSARRSAGDLVLVVTWTSLTGEAAVGVPTATWTGLTGAPPAGDARAAPPFDFSALSANRILPEVCAAIQGAEAVR